MIPFNLISRQINAIRYLARIALVTVTIAFLVACQNTPHATTVDLYKELPQDQEDTGYASSSVVAIMPLESAKSSFSSNETLTFASAFSLVQHYARAQERAKLDSLQFGLNVGLSQRGLNSTNTSSLQDSGGGRQYFLSGQYGNNNL